MPLSRQELMKPARDAVNWLKRKGWIIDPAKMDDYVQQVVMGMMGRTGSVQNWRCQCRIPAGHGEHVGSTVCVTGLAVGDERTNRANAWRRRSARSCADGDGSNRSGGEDEFSRIQGGAARAREAIQRAIAAVLDIDTEQHGWRRGSVRRCDRFVERSQPSG